MSFINPKTDFAFKKIFGSEQSQEILISFLNAILYDGHSTIQSLKILDPYQAPRIRGIKATYLDVKAQLETGETVIIEMQVLNVEGFEQRILYNAAKAYSIQLDQGEQYSLLNPVIALTITDFEMFPEIDAAISKFVLKEKYFLVDYPIHDLELVFVELPKFQRQLSELNSLSDKWIYFLKYAPNLEIVPESMGEVPAIQRAFEIANRATLTSAELDELERQLFYIQDQRGAITKAIKQGLQQGIQQGVEQGIQQGIQQGSKQAQLEIAQRLLNTMNDAEIVQVTRLTLAEIRSLRNEE